MSSQTKSNKKINVGSTNKLFDYFDSESDYDDEIDYENYTGSTKNRVIRTNSNYYRGPVGKIRMGKKK